MRRAIIIWLRNFFGFSRSEANGFIILSFLLMLVLILPLLSKQVFLHYRSGLHLDSDATKLDSLLALMDQNVIKKKQEAIKRSNEALHDFDLNTVSTEKLQEFGLPKYLADRVIKYREKVRPFETPADLLKIYGIDSTNFLRLQAFIKIKKLPPSAVAAQNRGEVKYEENRKEQAFYADKKKETIYPKYQLTAFNINTADSSQLMKIYGIGPVFAIRILAYRDLLGGFIDQRQFEEVYGLKGPNLDSLKKYAYVQEQVGISRLKLNTISEAELAKHPYISYRQAKLIIAFREMHGDFTRPADLLEIKILDSAFVSKIEDYLSFEQ